MAPQGRWRRHAPVQSIAGALAMASAGTAARSRGIQSQVADALERARLQEPAVQALVVGALERARAQEHKLNVTDSTSMLLATTDRVIPNFDREASQLAKRQNASATAANASQAVQRIVAIVADASQKVKQLEYTEDLTSSTKWLVISGVIVCGLFALAMYDMYVRQLGPKALQEAQSGAGEEPPLGARLWYLSFNMFFVVLNLLVGYVVYKWTNALTIEVDVLSFSCEFLAVGINIAIELGKRDTSMRRLLQLDLGGGLASLFLLVCVGIFGVYNAIDTAEELWDGDYTPPASHLNLMVRYSAFSLCLSFVNLGIFARFKTKMFPESGDVHDRLNILSNFAHSVVDLLTNVTVMGTSLWLVYGVKDPERWQVRKWFEMRENKVWIDVIGSSLVVLCIVISIFWLVRDIRQASTWIRELPEETA